MIRDLTRPDFLEFFGREMLLWRHYITKEVSYVETSRKTTLSEMNPVISCIHLKFNNFIDYAVLFKPVNCFTSVNLF